MADAAEQAGGGLPRHQRAFAAFPVQPQMRAIGRVAGRWRGHDVDPFFRQDLVAGRAAAMATQQFAKAAIIARGHMHDAAADHRARRVIFRGQAGQASRRFQPAVDEHLHRPPPRIGIVAIGQHPRHQVGQDHGAAGRVGKGRSGRMGQRLGLGKAAHILRAIGKQHPHRVASGQRVAILHMVQPRRHRQQLAQRNPPARVARLAPRIDRHRRVQRQPPVRHHQPDQYRRDALGDRPGQ